MNEMTVTVTWMDGTQETYKAMSTQVTERNNLVIMPTAYSGEPRRIVPLGNVRIYTLD